MPERNLQAFYPDLVRLGGETRLGSGAVLWKEGDPGDGIAMILEGSLDITQQVPGGDEVVLRTLEPGAVVGEMSTDGRQRSATVRARTACRILTVPAASFRALLKERPEILEELYWLQVERVRGLSRQVARARPAHRVITDASTHLHNFSFFRDRLEMEIDRARHMNEPLSLVLFDIDQFEQHGDDEEATKAALATVAGALKGAAHRADVLARYGGGQFVALLYGAPGSEARAFAGSVLSAVAARPGLTCSAGVATFPDDADGDEALVKAADICLYQAKEAGRNRVVGTGGA